MIISHKSAWAYKHLVLGAVAIFVYVGGEVAIGSFLVNYFKELVNMPEAEAGTYVALYWGGAMIGRFFGSITLSEMTDTKKKNIYAALVFVLSFGACTLCNQRISEPCNIFSYQVWVKL